MVAPGIVRVGSVLYSVCSVYVCYVALQVLCIEVVLAFISEAAYSRAVVIVQYILSVGSCFLEYIASVKKVCSSVFSRSDALCIVAEGVSAESFKKSYSVPNKVSTSVLCRVALGVIFKFLTVIAYQSVTVLCIVSVLIRIYRTCKSSRCIRILSL